MPLYQGRRIVTGHDAQGRSIVIGASGGAVQKSQHSCEVSFLMRDNWVTEVRYAGRTGNTLTPDEECAPIVRKCMNVR